LCSQHDCLLIFDEVISGFRIGFTGASGHYGIQPDIITYGKIIGGGMPVGAYGSSHEIMAKIAPEGPVYQAGTLSANPVAMAAGFQTLRELLRPGTYENLAKNTALLAERLETFAQENGIPFRVQHIGSIFWFSFSKDPIFRADQIGNEGMDKFKILHHELLQRGVYLGPSGYEVGFISTAHSKDDLSEGIEKIQEALTITFNS
ncbi:MAG: aminotransferase class III-fold pyridoxal phosphate-dependent enzyme, partial [Saprospiraceae bacterium]|nr:aminotransferase class III-fold pyridoxal phosphate-dependent enzyme [Saprospiraceae bacterium]